MENWITFIRSGNMTPLLKTAISHVEFEALHPFKDGNGRLGRIIITLLLWEYGLIRAPHFFVSAYFEEMRDDYIDLMRRVSSDDDWTEWCVFFLNGLNEQAIRNIETARRVFALYEEMKIRFRAELNSQWAIDALDFVFANPVFRNNRFTSAAGIPAHVAMRMTRMLRDADLLIQVAPASGRRPAMYSFEPLLKIVRG